MNGLFQVFLEASIRACGAAAIVGLILAAAQVRTGSVRHAAWAAVLFSMLLMPVLPYCVPRVALPAVPVRALATPSSAGELPELPPARPVARPQPYTPIAAVPAPVPGIAPVRQPFGSLAVFAAYVAGLIGLLARLLFGWRAAQPIARNVRLIPELSEQAAVYESSVIAMPLTVGIVAPKVVLPAAWTEWSGEKLRAVLAHEFAHVRRRDPIFSLLAQLNTCIFWFHPLAWWLQRKLAATAEHACDDEAIRAAGESRKYAEILLELADTVRQTGGRYSWQGIGIDGAGLLSRRIDRILQGVSTRTVSGTRKAAIGAGCAAAIFLAAACHRPSNVAPLQDGPRAAFDARNKAQQDFFNAAVGMSAVQAQSLEDAVAKNPEDLEARKKLLMFYYRSGVEVIGEEKTIAARRRQILWIIEHHPESELAGEWGMRIFPTALDALPDPAGYAEAKKLWLAQSERPGAPGSVLSNAALFFDAADKPLAEKMLLRGKSLDPKGPWSSRLGGLYYEVLVGSNASMPIGVVRSVSTAEAHRHYTDEIRVKLAQSTDPALLSAAGEMLVLRGQELYSRHVFDVDPLPVGKSYLERALQLDPQSIGAHRALIFVRNREGGYPIPQSLLKQPLEVQYGTVFRMPEPERFAALAILAANAYSGGDSADYYAHDQATAKADWARARNYAMEALKLAPNVRDAPRYGTAFYNANMVLGMVAMRDGDRKAAIRYLLEASKAPQTEELAYMMQPFTFKLPAWLLKDGERQPVIEFLDRFAQVDIAQSAYLRDSAQQIREGKKPLWYQY